MTGAGIIINALMAHGVDTVFGYPGGAVLGIYDELYGTPGIRHILTSHEQHAAHAADGYSRASGKTGVVIATSGPGATNLVTGIACAFMDSSPLVAITGNVPLSSLGRDSFQEVDISGITMPITKHNFIVKDIRDLERIMCEAFMIAGSGRPGPVLVDIPCDIAGSEYRYNNLTPMKRVQPGFPDAFQLQGAVQLISASRRPTILSGGGVILSGASGELAAFADRVGAAVTVSLMGVGSLPYDHPRNMGMAGMHGAAAAVKALEECDLLIVAGARLSNRAAAGLTEANPSRPVLHIDIDDAEIDKNIKSRHSLTGDAGIILRMLANMLPQNDLPDWQARLNGLRRQYPAEAPDEMRPSGIMRRVSGVLGGVRVVTDVGQHQMWAARYYPVRKARSFITSGGLGAMGFGMGAAIGAALAMPERVLLITGDGSFHMNLTELATAVSLHLPLIVLVMNNGVLGMVRQQQRFGYGGRYIATEPGRVTDFAAVARAFGADGIKADTESLDKALRLARDSVGPFVIDCRVDPRELAPTAPPPENGPNCPVL